MRVSNVTFSGRDMVVQFDTGEALAVSLSFFPELAAAPPALRERYTLIGSGIGVSWEGLDVDLSVENILNAHSRARLPAYA
jgi:hypothetical protein